MRSTKQEPNGNSKLNKAVSMTSFFFFFPCPLALGGAQQLCTGLNDFLPML